MFNADEIKKIADRLAMNKYSLDFITKKCKVKVRVNALDNIWLDPEISEAIANHLEKHLPEAFAAAAADLRVKIETDRQAIITNLNS